MLTIKLRRSGRKGLPFYHLVASEKRSKVLGKFNDKIGHYNPLGKGEFKIDKDKLKLWLDRGASLSQGVRHLLKHFKVKAYDRQEK